MVDHQQVKRLPSDACLLCGKKLEEVGGRRLVAQQGRGLKLSEKHPGGGNPDYPYQSVKLHDNADVYVVIWGEKRTWNEAILHKAREEYLKGFQPWFCQLCGLRQCTECGSPINFPMGSDILHDDGRVTHAGIFPFDPGCINPKCEKYREWKGSEGDG